MEEHPKHTEKHQNSRNSRDIQGLRLKLALRDAEVVGGWPQQEMLLVQLLEDGEGLTEANCSCLEETLVVQELVCFQTSRSWETSYFKKASQKPPKLLEHGFLRTWTTAHPIPLLKVYKKKAEMRPAPISSLIRKRGKKHERRKQWPPDSRKPRVASLRYIYIYLVLGWLKGLLAFSTNPRSHPP